MIIGFELVSNMKKKAKVLVAGATGYLGRYVVQEFKERSYWVRVLARNPKKLSLFGSFKEPAVDKLADEIFVGEVTKPETLQGLCDEIDIVFSSIGITRQRDGLNFMGVDYQGNKNLLDIAQQSSVKKFIFVSVFQANVIAHLAEARELFVRELQQSDLEYGVIRPTGYFSDMSEYLKMAQSGRVYLLGTGRNKINPIHGKDLARVCVEAAQDERVRFERDIGGPEVFSHEEIGELAFEMLNTRKKIFRIPMWVVKPAVNVVRPFSKQAYQMATFFMTVMNNDFVAPRTGNHFLKQYFNEISLSQ